MNGGDTNNAKGAKSGSRNHRHKGWRGTSAQAKELHGAGSWSTPGGHLEFGESLEECAIRETKEETGVSITDVKFRAVTNDIFEESGKHYITIWMQGNYSSGKAVINAA